MNSFVSVEIRHMRERLVTICALVRLYAGMGFDVTVEISLLVECFAAYAALVVSFLHVERFRMCL